MTQHTLFKIASCLIFCVLFSCNESNQEETSHLSVTDSNKSIKDSGRVVNNEDDLESAKTDSSLKLAEEKINNLAELNKRLTKKASYFVIKTNRDTVIECREGTLLSIPANAFLNASNQSLVAGEIKISVKEFYKISDMMIAGLTTTSNDKLLETGGMISINATNKATNDSCILKSGKNIIIAMANSDTTNVDGMQLFNGAHGNTSIDWAPRSGVAGLAQRWRFGRNSFSQYLPPLNAGFVFPDEIMKVKPMMINSNPENLQSETKMSVRELIQNVGVVTKKVNGYIDTSGNLHCYNIGISQQRTSFTDIYSPTIYQDMKVNLCVDVKLSYKSNLNHNYYLKLFKMGKGNPDSLIATTVTLNPVVKITSVEKIRGTLGNAVTVTEYQKNQKHRAALVREYEKRIKQLRLDDENKLAKSESQATTNLQSAQNYLLLSTTKLGWINCDRFNDDGDKVDYLVTLKEPASVLIVFNRIKSILTSDITGAFKGVPLNEKITIVALKTENGKLMMALHETSVTEQPFEELSFKHVTVKEYKNRLEKLNRL